MDGGTKKQEFYLEPLDSVAAASLAALRSMQQDGQLCDVVLEAEGAEQISAHRAILAGCSPYFRGMFVNKLAESSQKVVYIKDIDLQILQAVVSYAYNAKFSLSSDQVLPLLIASDRFQIAPLFLKCCRFLETQLTAENCLSLQAFAELHKCEELFQQCSEFASENFEKVILCDEYLSLPSDQLKALISRDEVRVSCEEKIYSAVLQWVYHDFESRKEEFSSIMSCVRLPFVSSDFLSCQVEQEHLVQTEEQCREFLQEAYLYKTSPEKRPSLKHSPRTKPRKLSGLQDVIIAAGGMGKSRLVSSVEQYDMRTDSWTSLSELELPRYGLSVCFHNGCLYTAGGYSNVFGYLNCMECYNLRENEWRMVAPMHQARRYHKMEVLYGLLYITGGQSTEGILSSVERYDPASDSWTFMEPMTSLRMYHGLAEMDKLLFAIGGHDGHVRLRSVEFYDPAHNYWVLVSPMIVPRSVAGVASLGGSIYVVGGYDGKEYLDSVEYYDIELDQWFMGPSMTCRRSALGLVAYRGSLYACGGFNGSFISSVECFVLGNETWDPVVRMQVERVHFGITCT